MANAKSRALMGALRGDGVSTQTPSRINNAHYSVHHQAGPRFNCLVCEHSWPIKGHNPPRLCPHCQSSVWNKPPEAYHRVTCTRCKHVWNRSNDSKGMPCCSQCGNHYTY